MEPEIWHTAQRDTGNLAIGSSFMSAKYYVWSNKLDSGPKTGKMEHKIHCNILEWCVLYSLNSPKWILCFTFTRMLERLLEML